MSPTTNTSKVKYVGNEEVYSGWDGDQMVNLSQGETAEVSEAKAAQLAEDRPYDFEINGNAAKSRPRTNQTEEPAAGEPASIDELMKRKREQLDKTATGLGITDPSAMADKRTVALAILAAIEDGSAG